MNITEIFNQLGITQSPSHVHEAFVQALNQRKKMVDRGQGEALVINPDSALPMVIWKDQGYGIGVCEAISAANAKAFDEYKDLFTGSTDFDVISFSEYKERLAQGPRSIPADAGSDTPVDVEPVTEDVLLPTDALVTLPRATRCFASFFTELETQGLLLGLKKRLPVVEVQADPAKALKKMARLGWQYRLAVVICPSYLSEVNAHTKVTDQNWLEKFQENLEADLSKKLSPAKA